MSQRDPIDGQGTTARRLRRKDQQDEAADAPPQRPGAPPHGLGHGCEGGFPATSATIRVRAAPRLLIMANRNFALGVSRSPTGHGSGPAAQKPFEAFFGARRLGLRSSQTGWRPASPSNRGSSARCQNKAAAEAIGQTASQTNSVRHQFS